jgi:hypothetical protein
MLKLSADPTFHYELLRVLGTSRDRWADAGEVLTAAAQIIPGDFDSWYIQFAKLADHVLNSVDQQSNLHPVSIRNAMFRAATYYRAADFFCTGIQMIFAFTRHGTMQLPVSIVRSLSLSFQASASKLMLAASKSPASFIVSPSTISASAGRSAR